MYFLYLSMHIYTYIFTDENNKVCSFSTNICSLETSPGVLLRISAESKNSDFNSSVLSRDVRGTCGHLVSLIAQDSIETVPMKLFASEVSTSLQQNVKLEKTYKDDEAIAGVCASGLPMYSQGLYDTLVLKEY